jgi:UDP-GlcNAc:undecaprenyl-phosphate GlcNAc-1-phosphate transferase
MLVAALAEGHLPLAMAVIPLVGALFGFLRYNFHPASVYLGDAGSLLIGFVLGCCGALWSEKSVALVAMTAPMLAVSVPLLDVTLSILRRFLRNKPIFKGDRGHIHHKLLDRGLSPRVAVLTVYGLCALMAALSLLANALRNQFTGVVVVVFCTLLWIFVRSLGYAEFAMATRMFLKGGFQRVIDTEAKLEDLRRALASAENVNECWKMILTASREFGFGGVRMSVAGNVFEESTDSSNGPVWQLRIPLAEAQYINFARDFEADVNPLVLSAFVNCIQTGLMARMSELESIPVRIPAKPQLAFSGAVGSSAKPS